MFTGIVECVGRVRDLVAGGGDARVGVLARLAGEPLTLGESISVSGVCLTVVEIFDDGFAADVSNETLAHTTLGELRAGDAVNLERALRASDRLGGHIVSGHVDGVGTLTGVEQDARSVRFTCELPADLARYVAPKGSVCLDGVSLTVNGVLHSQFDVNIVPHTQSVTTLAQWAVGSRVNVEIDVVARYVERILTHGPTPQQ